MIILYATDFSESSNPAETQALRLAKALGGEVIFLHVAQETPLFGEGPFGMADVQRVYDAQRQWATDALAARVQAASEAGVAARSVLKIGVPFQEIVKAADETKADLIVMGTHGRTGLDRLLLGSVAERVIRLAASPVLTVRPTPGR